MKHLVRLLLIAWPLVYGVAHAQVPPGWPDVTYPPKVALADLPKGFNVKRVAFWTVSTPTGYRNTWIVYNDADLAPWLLKLVKGSYSKAEATAACQRLCDVIYEDNLVAAVKRLQAPYLAKAVVAKNGDYTSRPVRTIRPDGSLGDVIASTIARAPVGAPCKLNGRVTGSWFSVEGQPNVASNDPAARLGRVAATCSITLPIGSNGE